MDLSSALQAVALSDSGRVRNHNEDAVLVDARLGLVILADGMGGYNAGEVASQLAISVASQEVARAFSALPPHEKVLGGTVHARFALEEAVARANSAIFEAAQTKPQYNGMGTTIVAVVFYDNSMTVVHVGDSRLYRLRDGVMSQMTRDHSLLQDQLDSGMLSAEEARRSANRNLVTKALGVEPAVEPGVSDFETRSGDVYLLCSDGLNDMLEDDEIARELGDGSGPLDAMAARLIQGANDHGGKDNVSVILVRIKRDYSAKRGVLARLTSLFG
jgi:protein phosphatase